MTCLQRDLAPVFANMTSDDIRRVRLAAMRKLPKFSSYRATVLKVGGDELVKRAIRAAAGLAVAP